MHADYRAFLEAYESTILGIIKSGYIGDKLYHLLAGLIIWLVVALVSRRPLNSWVPLTIIVVVELANEALDVLYGNATVWGTVTDCVSTWFFPFAISAMIARSARRRPAAASLDDLHLSG
jgi:hypothetical protein